jgi:CCR4-NOT transcription complex subunit 4
MSYLDSEIKHVKHRNGKKQLLNFTELSEARIITKNLVYVIGLSSRIASREILQSKEYFGLYGTITKTVVNKNKAYNSNNPKGPSFSAYITYSKPYEASIAILSLDNIIIDDHLIRASFGTTK